MKPAIGMRYACVNSDGTKDRGTLSEVDYQEYNNGNFIIQWDGRDGHKCTTTYTLHELQNDLDVSPDCHMQNSSVYQTMVGVK